MTKFDFRRCEHAGYANSKSTWIHLHNIYSTNELYETIEHEDVHHILFKLGIFDPDKHHWAMQQMWID